MSFLSHLKALGRWVAEAGYVWLSLFVIAVALLISLRPNTSEPVIRLTGLALQLMGIGTVIWGISETRGLFGHPSLTAKTTVWLKRFPLLRRDVDTFTCVATLGVPMCKSRAHTIHRPIPSPTVEARLDALEKNIGSIHERITGTQGEMDIEVRKIEAVITNEIQIRQTEDSAIQKKLEATGTGGVHISAIGASWLFVGVILSTAAVEIAKVLSRA